MSFEDARHDGSLQAMLEIGDDCGSNRLGLENKNNGEQNTTETAILFSFSILQSQLFWVMPLLRCFSCHRALLLFECLFVYDLRVKNSLQNGP